MPTRFCFLDIRSDPDVWISLLNAIITIVLMTYSAINYRRTQKIVKHINLRPILYSILIWGAFFLSEIVFATTLILIKRIDVAKEQNLSAYSKVYSAIDKIPAFIVQGLFLFIPYNILGKVFAFSVNRGFFLKPAETYFYQFLKYYQIFRLLFLATSFIIFIPDNNEADSLYIIALIEISSTVFDAMLCNVCLLTSQQIIKRRQTIIKFLSDQDLAQLKRELLILNLACLSRWIFDFIFYIQYLDSDNDSKCQDKEYEVGMNTILFLFVGNLFMHFIPIFVIIKMYSYQERDHQRDKDQYDYSITERLNDGSSKVSQ